MDIVNVKTRWTIKERRSGIWVPVVTGLNVMTDYGLTALAGAFGGTYTPPIYLVIDIYKGSIQNAGGIAAGVTSVTLDNRVDESGDTQIILGLGTANEETVSFSAVSGSGPYIYTVSTTTKSHAQNDPCVRAPKQSDTIAKVQNEIQYAPTVFPGKRAAKTGNGYSSGTGNHVMSFFITGSQAVATWTGLGTSDSETAGANNLHSHLAKFYDHTSGNDVQIDVSLTLANA